MSAEEPDWASVALLAELGVMAQGLLHELRQPLFAATAALELEAARDPALAPRLDVALRQLRHLGDVIEAQRLGAYADVEAVHDLRVPLTDAVSMLRHRAGLAGAALHVDCGRERLPVRARQASVRQVALNLLANGIDAVEGQPRRDVALRARRDGASAVVEVIDSGPGLDDGVAERLFGRFVSTKGVRRGTGLGLYVCRTLVEDAGGRVELATRPDGGCRAVVVLPLAE